MILGNLSLWPGHERPGALYVRGPYLGEKETLSPKSLMLDLEGANVWPGLINAHDHLEFNLYPPLKKKTYEDDVAWSEDLHRSFPETIKEIEAIPVATRRAWGILKNLVCGVTTVLDHGPPNRYTTASIGLITHYQWIHSISHQRGWQRALNRFWGINPVVLHLAEGVSQRAREETRRLFRWNFFKRSIVIVHGIGISPEQGHLLRGLVWCPNSNFFLYGETAPIHKLRGACPILFGTDSTLTTTPSIWDHLREAKDTQYLRPSELYEAVTEKGAVFWGFRDRGILRPGMSADLFVTQNNGARGLEAFFSIDPEEILLVMRRGELMVVDQWLCNQLPFWDGIKHQYTGIQIQNRLKWVRMDLPTLTGGNVLQKTRVRFPFPLAEV